MKWTGWAKSERRKDYYGKSVLFLVLSPEGEQALERIESLRDLRAADLQGTDEPARSALVRVAFYQMLDRSGFDTESVRDQVAEDLVQAAPLVGDAPAVLFSPFQELSPQYVARLFPKVAGTKIEDPARLDTRGARSMLPQVASEVSLSETGVVEGAWDRSGLTPLFEDAARNAGEDLSAIADYIADAHRDDNQDEFYPFVARLFGALGYECHHSRSGVNSQRYDAIISDPELSIPIEIKSPGEEEFLSVKAVRQALENKVILLSRKHYPTRPDVTSLVVGYNPPRNRSEVASLVTDIRAAFGVVIGVVDLRSLLRLVAATILQGKRHNVEELRTLHGIIQVEDAQTQTA